MLRGIGAAANDAQWERLADLQLRLRRLARRLETALMEPVKLKSDFELVDFAPLHCAARTVGRDSAARLAARVLGDAQGQPVERSPSACATRRASA